MFFYVVRQRSQNSLETSAFARIGPVGSQTPEFYRCADCLSICMSAVRWRRRKQAASYAGLNGPGCQNLFSTGKHRRTRYSR
jgi:hypothetical protein